MNIIAKAKTEGLILDGAMGTMLIREGLKGGKASEFWNLEKPKVIRNIHKSYFDAGADIVVTNTFGATLPKLQKAGLGDKIEAINKIAVQQAKAAACAEKYVAGDIGPTGEMLKPYGNLSLTQAIASYAEQAEYLDKAGVDLFIIETMFDLNEALAAIEGIQSVSKLPIFATLTFKQMKTGFATMMGNRVETSMQALIDAGAVAVGANCSIGSDTMLILADQIRQSITEPVIIQPNAGRPETKGIEVVYPETKDYFSDNIKRIKELGVEIVGGCCGTTPDYIRSIVEKIR
ncbi:MAG: homocysteine S-methyltransferase family protein [Desulfobacterales bacterium]|nr:homocysteine S-methyltransferase family protein [Desulfobacterales bacterium]